MPFALPLIIALFWFDSYRPSTGQPPFWLLRTFWNMGEGHTITDFGPFVAGVARMNYRRFVLYNVAGGAGWVFLMTVAGYWLGQIDFIQRNFEKSILVVVALSIVVPVAIGALKHRR